MPLSLDTIQVQPSNSGNFSGASGTASLPTGTTAGSTVLICVASNASTMTSTGFTVDSGAQAGVTSKAYLLRKSNVSAGETSWTLSAVASSISHWVAYELADLDPDLPVDVKMTSTTGTISGTTASTGTLARSTTYDGLLVAIHTSYITTTTTPTTFSGHTNGMVETDEGAADDGVSKAVNLSVSMQAVQQLGTYQSTATASATLSASNTANATIVCYSAQGARREANVAHFWGFKLGAGAAGLSIGLAGVRYAETAVGSPSITANGLQLVGAASAQSITTATMTASGVLALVARLKLRFDGSLPGADVELANLKPTGDTANPLTLRYRSASQKLGVQIGGGTEQLSAATVTADTWYGVDLRLITTTTTYLGDWQLDDGTGPVAQTQASVSGAAGSTSQYTAQLGWTAAATATVTYAYAVYSVVAGHYPLGEYTMVLLKPDPAATPTVSGTVGNFALITNNATGATLTSGTLSSARDAVDEFPPTVGASADGVCQITAAASDYLEFPLETYDAASNGGSVRAGRVVVCGWAASATAATIGVRGYDGTVEKNLFPAGDPSFDNTSTPAWICEMWRPTNGWDQTKLNAAAIRFGFSDDATPDIGAHALGMEIAVKPGTTLPLFGDLASAVRDPDSAGIISATMTPPVGYDTTLHYEEGGSPTDVAVAGGTAHTEVIAAADAPTVNYVAAYPPPEGIPDA